VDTTPQANASLHAIARALVRLGECLALSPTCADGVDHHTPVTPDYQQRGNEFNGKIGKVKIELK